MEYAIGEFSAKTGLSIHTLRYYEKEGLISPSRQKNGRRAYSEVDIEWVAFIQRLKQTNMPLKAIKQYAQLRAEGQSTLYARKEMLQAHRNILKAHIKNLQNNLGKLDEKLQYYDTEIEKEKK